MAWREWLSSGVAQRGIEASLAVATVLLDRAFRARAGPSPRPLVSSGEIVAFRERGDRGASIVQARDILRRSRLGHNVAAALNIKLQFSISC